jgi:hypothetical protein
MKEKSDAEWEADMDADALIRAHEIQSDPKRAKKAATALKRKEKEAAAALATTKAARGLKKAIT